MNARIRTHLLEVAGRLTAKGVFGTAGDTLSMRVPGLGTFLLLTAGDDEPRTVSMADPGSGEAAVHARIYGARPDVFAVAFGTSPWTSVLAPLGPTVPVLFDEQARHIGPMRAATGSERSERLVAAFSGGANAAFDGKQRACLGSTPERIVFNTDLFEKCAKAWVIARSAGRPVRRIPWWVRVIAARRLRRDQRRAARSLTAGSIPTGMNAY